MENFSEKPKRGRPRRLDPTAEALYRNLYPEHGARSLQNTIYLIEAFGWLKDETACAWLMEKTPQGEWKRRTLMQELGRFPDRETALEAALWVCERRPKVREGVIELRRLRLAHAGVEPQLAGDSDELMQVLAKAIDGYRKRYPKTPWADVLEALEALVTAVEERVS
jgi:hypothetical protein